MSKNRLFGAAFVGAIAGLLLQSCAQVPVRIDRSAYRMPERPVTNLLSSSNAQGSYAEAGDGSSIADLIKKSGGSKGEYESSQQYEQRLRAMVPAKISFTRALDRAWYTYDADSQLLKISIILDDGFDKGYRENSGMSAHYPAILLGGSIKFTDQYVGQNAFGASVQVDQVLAKKNYAVLGALPRNSTLQISSITGDLSVPREEMSVSSKDLAIRIDGDTKAPFYAQSADHQKATIASRQETISALNFFRVAPSKISIINLKTGKVYSESLKATSKAY
jgi:hypothetical protein